MKNQGIIIRNTKKVKLANTSIKNNQIKTVIDSEVESNTELVYNQGHLIEEVESLEVTGISTENNSITEKQTKKRKRKTSQEKLQNQVEEVIAMEIDEHLNTSSSSQIQQLQAENNYLHSQQSKIEEITKQQIQVKSELTQQELDAYWDNLKNEPVKVKETEQETQIIYNPHKNS